MSNFVSQLRCKGRRYFVIKKFFCKKKLIFLYLIMYPIIIVYSTVIFELSPITCTSRTGMPVEIE